MVRSSLIIVAVLAVFGVAAVSGTLSPANAQGALQNCSAGQIQLSANERTAEPGMVIVEVTATTSGDCNVEDLTALLIDAQRMPIPNMQATDIAIDRTVHAGTPELVATLLWRNWCDDPALGPYGVAFKSRSAADLTVPRLASTPLCFDDSQEVILEFELPAPSGEQVRPGLLSIGRRIERLLLAGDAAAVAELFETREFTCPGDAEYPFGVCEGEADGTIVTGYEVGRWASEGGVLDRDGLVAFLDHESELFVGDDIRLYTVAESGFGGCPECGLLAYSTPSDIANDDGTASIILVQVRPVSGEFRIYNVIGGFVSLPREAAMVLGGSYSGLDFISIEPEAPEPPDTGTGTAPSGSSETARFVAVALFVVTSGAFAVVTRGRFWR